MFEKTTWFKKMHKDRERRSFNFQLLAASVALCSSREIWTRCCHRCTIVLHPHTPKWIEICSPAPTPPPPPKPHFELTPNFNTRLRFSSSTSSQNSLFSNPRQEGRRRKIMHRENILWHFGSPTKTSVNSGSLVEEQNRIRYPVFDLPNLYSFEQF